MAPSVNRRHTNKKKKRRFKNYSLEQKVKYLTRSRAVKKLQITLNDFRRLCILKGIYPQTPNGKKFSTTKIYYFKRDINLISREPILNRYRELKIYLRRKKKQIALKNKTEVKRLKGLKPSLNYDHLVKERYPTFEDALSDLSDPLSLLNLFNLLPSKSMKGFNYQKIKTIKTLITEFNAIVAKRRLLEKTFVSIKGFYFQVNVDGKMLLWLVPHRFISNLPEKVDYSCLVTFMNFYISLLKFVNYKLFNDEKLTYPPSETETSLCLKSLGESSKVKASKKESVEENKKSENFTDKNETDKIDTFSKEKRLFENFTFLLMKETPYEILSFVINSFGGKVYIETDFKNEDLQKIEKKITHKIVDRPLKVNLEEKTEKIKTFETIQPQWVFDSVNEKIILPVDRYAQGKICPDHLSPFVSSLEEGYKTKEGEYRENLKNPDKKPEIGETSNVNETSVIRAVKSTDSVKFVDNKESKVKELGKIMMKKGAKRDYAKLMTEELNKKEKTMKLLSKRKKFDGNKSG